MCFGIHLWSTVPLFDVGVGAGAVTAYSDRFFIKVSGRGGHGSSPHQTCDPVVAAASLVTQAQQVVSRHIDPCKPAVVSFGGIKSNSYVPNVIPESVELCGTTRCFETTVRDQIKERLGEICSGIGTANRVPISFDFRQGYPATINHEEATRVAREAASKISGARVVPPTPVLAGEDFSYYSLVPGIQCCFVYVGAQIADDKLRPHHSPEFDFDERALLCSASLFLQIVDDQCGSTRRE